LAYASYTPVARQVRGLLERPDGNNVSVERESLLLAETQMKFNLGVQLVRDQFHQISAAITGGGTTP
jgi:flagellar basal-body rod protein FlgB